MPTNPNVLKDRTHYIGSSEISTIMGINKFKNRYDLLQEKAELLRDEFNGNPYTEYGEWIEPQIRDYINESEEDKFIEDTIIEEHEVINFRCNYDGLNKTTGLEIKSTSEIHKTVREYKYYLVQLLWGMMLGKRKYGKLAVFHRTSLQDKFNPDRLQIFDIEISDYKDIIDEIKEAVDQFIKDLEKIKNNPFLEEKDLLQEKLPLDVQRQILMVEEMEKQLKEYKQIEEKQKKLKEQIKTAMQEHGVDKWITPSGTMIKLVADGEDKEVYKINEEKLKEEYPIVYASVAEQTIQKGRAGYIRITKEK